MSVRLAAGATALALVVSACSGSAAPPDRTSSARSASTVTAPVVTRWWSNSAHRAGSAIDGTTVALRPSRADYCGMLRATVAAGHSILPGASAGDPRLLAATQAFVGEVEQVAPDPVAADWKTVGTAVVTLVKARGSLSALKNLDAAAIGQAVGAIAADARSSCGVRLGK